MQVIRTSWDPLSIPTAGFGMVMSERLWALLATWRPDTTWRALYVGHFAEHRCITQFEEKQPDIGPIDFGLQETDGLTWINYLVSPVGSFGFLFAFYVKYPMVSAQVGLFECIGEQKKTSNRLEFSMNLAYFMVTLPIFHHLVFDIHIQNPCQEPCIHTIGGKFSRWLGQFQHPHLHLWAVHQQPGRDFQSRAACSAFSVKHDETTHCQDSLKKIMMNPGLPWPIGVIQVAFSADFWRFLSLGSADDQLDASRWQNDQWSGHLSQFRAWKSRTWMELYCVYLKKGHPKISWSLNVNHIFFDFPI